MSVAQFLTDHQVYYETLLHPPAFTSQKRAKYARVPGRHVAKSVLLVGPDGYFLAVLPATQRVDPAALAFHLGGPIRLADDCEIADLFRDCEWGVVSPFGSRYGLRTVLEDTLPPEALLLFEGHSHAEAIRLRCHDFERVENPRRLRFAR